jgi:hypothetical protein
VNVKPDVEAGWACACAPVSSRGQIDAHIGRAQLAMEAQRTHFHGPSLLVLQSDDVDSAQYISPAFTMGIPLDIALG